MARVDPRLYNTAYGSGSLIMSLPFLAFGAFFAISSYLETDFIKEGANAPIWVIGVVGLIFFFAGLLLFRHSVISILRRRKAAAMAGHRNRPEPWQYDHDWDGFVVRDEAGSRAFGQVGMLMFLTLFISPFVWWGFFSDDGNIFVKSVVSIFLLVWLWIAWDSVYRILQFAKYGGSTLSLERFPYFLGDELKVAYSNHHFVELNARLRYIEEKFVESRGDDGVRHDSNELWGETRRVRVAADEVATFTFTPSTDDTGGNELIAAEDAPSIRYWDLLVWAEAPGIDFKTTFLLPVYDRSDSRQKINSRFGRERAGRGSLFGFVPFEAKAGLLAVLAVATLLWFQPELPGKVVDEVETAYKTRELEQSVTSINLMMGGLDISVAGDVLWLLNKRDLFRYENDHAEQLMDFQTYQKTFNHKFNSFSSLYVAQDEVFVGSWYGELFRYHAGRWQELMSLDDFPIGRIYAMADLRGELYLAGKGLYRWDRQSSVPVAMDLTRGSRIEAVLQLEDSLLLGAYKNLLEWRGTGDPIQIARLPGRIESIRNSPHGFLIGTTKGLYLLRPGDDQPLALLTDVVVNVAVADNLGRIYVGTRKNGLMVSEANDFLRWESISGLPGYHILDLVIHDNRLWISDYQAGFSYIDLKALQR